MSVPGALPPEMEMANLEHALAVLRDRYSTMVRETKRVNRVFKYGGSMAIAAAIVALMYLGTRSSDALPILFLVIGLVAVIGLIAWLSKDWLSNDLYNERYPFRTDEEFLNHAIAIRERRPAN
ncbi:MAG: hypothetical protein K2Y27_09095 [Xanthobacteraceae bacterium]|nr:hypothetical protein [Xanthobacteraceae bacterium]